jgi:hypothetical protein
MRGNKRNSPEPKWDFNSAMSDLRSGHTIKETAKKYGVSYCCLYQSARKHGVSGGVTQRDNRPLEVKVWESVQRMESGCWKWTGRTRHKMKAGVPATPRGLVRYVLGIKDGPTPGRRNCGNSWCLNPEHDSAVCKFSRNEEILIRWRLHVQHYTTMDKLAEKFGITRQRVEQIIRRGDGPRTKVPTAIHTAVNTKGVER